MIRIFFAFFFVIGVLSADEAADPFAALHQNVHTFMKQRGFSHGVVAIAKKGQVISHAEWGNMTVNKIIPIASLSKIFTMWATIHLIEAGDLKWDTPISPFFPVEKVRDERVHKITVMDLLDHRGGWKIARSADPLFNISRHNGKSWTPEKYGSWFLSNYSLQCTPGTDYSYCNSGYVMMGRIIELVTNVHYFDYINTLLAIPNDVKIEKAKTSKNNRFYSLELSRASFGLSSSAEGVARLITTFRGEWFQTGSLAGLLTGVAHRHRSGLAVVVLIPQRNDGNWLGDVTDLKNVVLDSVENWWMER